MGAKLFFRRGGAHPPTSSDPPMSIIGFLWLPDESGFSGITDVVRISIPERLKLKALSYYI